MSKPRRAATKILDRLDRELIGLKPVKQRVREIAAAEESAGQDESDKKGAA